MITSLSASTSRLQNIFGVDLRSLALFRVLLGAVLFCTLTSNLCHVDAWYSDSGIAPRSWVIEIGSATHLSLYFLDGSSVFTVTLLLVQIACALMLMLGWRTRLASVASFVLWASLMNRNPDVTIPADQQIAGLLFWSLFLPLGTRYSMDTALTAPKTTTENQYVSWASAGLLFQIIASYFFSTLAARAESGTFATPVLYYWFNLDGYTSTLAQTLKLQFPVHSDLRNLLVCLNLFSPLLIFAPVRTQRVRLVAMASFALMQLFILVFFDVGAHPWVTLAALALLPGALVWDGLKRRDERRNSGTLRLYYDGEHPFSRVMCRVLQEFLILPRAQLLPAQDTPRTRALMQANQSWIVLDADDQATMKWSALVTLLKRSPVFFWLAPLLSFALVQKAGDALYDALARHRTMLDRFCAERPQPTKTAQSPARWKTYFCALMLIAYVLSSLAVVKVLPRELRSSLAPLLEIFRLDQTWTLYSVSVLENDGWLMASAKLADGSETDLLRANNAAPDFNKPPHAIIAADGPRWLHYRDQLWLDDSANHRRQYLYGRYLCSQWNEAHADDKTKLATQLTLIYMLERTPPPGHTPQIEQRVLSTQECPTIGVELTH